MGEIENRREQATAAGCASFETTDGHVVFYDRENGDAWIQSDRTIDFDEVRATGPSE